MEQNLQIQVEAIADHLHVVRQLMRRAANLDLAEFGLTAPQVNVLRVLSDTNGLSLKELSEQVGLAHSTVSGIIDRLEQRELVTRRVDAIDRRFTRIYTTEMVARYLKHELPSRRLNLLSQALQAASPDEREQILEGLTLLRCLIEAKSTK